VNIRSSPNANGLSFFRDVDGQIARCLERIEDKIMPKFFKEKLKGLQASKAYYE
jgi:hypothetical protein